MQFLRRGGGIWKKDLLKRVGMVVGAKLIKPVKSYMFVLDAK